MTLETIIVEQGGPKPTEEINTGCGCGGTCGGDCKCGGTCGGDCGGDCGCGGKDLSTPSEATTIPNLIKQSTEKASSVSKKYITNENLLKFAIALSIGAAAYIIIKD